MDETKDHRQALIDQLGEVLGQLFCEGLSEKEHVAQRAIVDGLASKRIQIQIQIKMPPLHVVFSVVRENCEPLALFEIADATEKTLKLAVVDPMAGAPVN